MPYFKSLNVDVAKYFPISASDAHCGHGIWNAWKPLQEWFEFNLCILLFYSGLTCVYNFTSYKF